MPPSVPITAVVTAHRRIDQTLATLRKLRACEPAPAEILVHVDGNQTECVEAIRREFPEIEVIVSRTCVGPGGGRNKLVAAAGQEFVASFDDDSFPIDTDYFARAVGLFDRFPKASIIGAAVYERDQPVGVDAGEAAWGSDFAGGACVFRKSAFLAAGGYVPLRVAYGMEEVDLALRLHARGGRILRTPWLRVFHDTDLRRHAAPEVTAASIANVALLAYLRYPPSCWLIGLGQCLNRAFWLVRHGRWRGMLRGFAMIPTHLRAHRQYRERLGAPAIRSYLALRRAPVRAVW